MNGKVRQFDSGATRDNDEAKYDFEGFLSPLTLHRYGEYMHRHRKQADGSLRDSDNWQKGIPLPAYMKSLWRHMKDAWAAHRGYPTSSGEGLEDELCAIIFNASGYLHELLKSRLEANQPLKDHRRVATKEEVAAYYAGMAGGFMEHGS